MRKKENEGSLLNSLIQGVLKALPSVQAKRKGQLNLSNTVISAGALPSVLNFLDVPSLVKAAEVSKDFKRATDHDFIWKKFFYKTYPYPNYFIRSFEMQIIKTPRNTANRIFSLFIGPKLQFLVVEKYIQAQCGNDQSSDLLHRERACLNSDLFRYQLMSVPRSRKEDGQIDYKPFYAAIDARKASLLEHREHKYTPSQVEGICLGLDHDLVVSHRFVDMKQFFTNIKTDTLFTQYYLKALRRGFVAEVNLFKDMHLRLAAFVLSKEQNDGNSQYPALTVQQLQEPCVLFWGEDHLKLIQLGFSFDQYKDLTWYQAEFMVACAEKNGWNAQTVQLQTMLRKVVVSRFIDYAHLVPIRVKCTAPDLEDSILTCRDSFQAWNFVLTQIRAGTIGEFNSDVVRRMFLEISDYIQVQKENLSTTVAECGVRYLNSRRIGDRLVAGQLTLVEALDAIQGNIELTETQKEGIKAGFNLAEVTAANFNQFYVEASEMGLADEEYMGLTSFQTKALLLSRGKEYKDEHTNPLYPVLAARGNERKPLTRKEVSLPDWGPFHTYAVALNFDYKEYFDLTHAQADGLVNGLSREQVKHDWFGPFHAILSSPSLGIAYEAYREKTPLQCFSLFCEAELKKHKANMEKNGFNYARLEKMKQSSSKLFKVMEKWLPANQGYEFVKIKAKFFMEINKLKPTNAFGEVLITVGTFALSLNREAEDQLGIGRSLSFER